MVQNLQKIKEESEKREKEYEDWLKQIEEERRNRPPIFTPMVKLWILCFIIMIASLVYKECYLVQYSDDWRFFSAIHIITALICILGVTIHNIKTQHVFDEDIEQINSYIKETPIIRTERNKIYANDRERYEHILGKFQDYVRLAKRLFFFGIIGLTVVFFIWDITQYFLAPNAYVVRLTSDIGWTISAHQIYFLGLILTGGSIIVSVMLREYIKSITGFFTTIVHLGSLIDTISNLKNKADQKFWLCFFIKHYYWL